jgi:hypothetical protein
MTTRQEHPVQTYSTQTDNGPSSTTDQARETAQQAAGEAKGALRSQLEQRSTEAGRRVSDLVSDVRSVSAQLREQGKDQPAKLADQAADRAERVSGYLTENDADRILHDVEDFGRRQPWVVIAGGVALGLVASRFLKASSSRRYEQRWETSGDRLPARTQDISPTASGIHTSPAGGSEPPVMPGLEGSR